MSTAIGIDGCKAGWFVVHADCTLAGTGWFVAGSFADALDRLGDCEVIGVDIPIGLPDSGSFGEIRSGSLEQSTVDLAAQFVRLIVNQRAFQANTRTVSVTNELLANLVSLGQ